MSVLPVFPDRYNAKEAAHILGIRESTLAVWRSTKRYLLSYIKIGRKVFYGGQDLKKFIESCILPGCWTEIAVMMDGNYFPFL